VNPAELPREELAPLAREEGKTLAAWHGGGQVGPRPATPVSDFLAANPAASRASKKVGSSRGVLPADGVLAFYIGNPGEEEATRLVAETQHAWSYMAGYTRDSHGPEPLTTRELLGRLRDAGITDPDHMPATIALVCAKGVRIVTTRLIPGRVLPDGRVIGEDGTPVAVKPAATRKPRTRKPAAAKDAPAA
jgi:hypothetical protein